MLDSVVKSWESSGRFVRRACRIFVKMKDTFLHVIVQEMHAIENMR